MEVFEDPRIPIFQISSSIFKYERKLRERYVYKNLIDYVFTAEEKAAICRTIRGYHKDINGDIYTVEVTNYRSNILEEEVLLWLELFDTSSTTFNPIDDIAMVPLMSHINARILASNEPKNSTVLSNLVRDGLRQTTERRVHRLGQYC